MEERYPEAFAEMPRGWNMPIGIFSRETGTAGVIEIGADGSGRWRGL